MAGKNPTDYIPIDLGLATRKPKRLKSKPTLWERLVRARSAGLLRRIRRERDLLAGKLATIERQHAEQKLSLEYMRRELEESQQYGEIHKTNIAKLESQLAVATKEREVLEEVINRNHERVRRETQIAVMMQEGVQFGRGVATQDGA